MGIVDPGSASKRPVHLDLDAALMSRAEALGVDIAAAAEAGLVRVVADAERRDVEQRAEAAMRAWNEYTARHGSVADDFGAA